MFNYVKQAGLLVTLLFVMSGVYASDIEEVIVVGAKVKYSNSNPESESNALEAIDPTRVFQAGGLGGFHAATINGTDAKHTAVYRNGIPVNDVGNGWYDFGTELSNNQIYQIISGPNSALYGSSSMGGTILIEDTFDRSAFFQGGEDMYRVFAGNDYINVGQYRGSSGSARSNNTEKDFFESTNMRSKFVFGDWSINTNSQKYETDYDGCWNADWVEVNDCLTKGEKHDVSIRGDWLTIGYSRNDAQFYTEGVQTWSAVSERYFADANKEVTEGVVIGLQGHREEYGPNWDEHLAAYLNVEHVNDDMNKIGFSYRFEEKESIFRLGGEYGLFRISAANSIRKPNLYERYGDGFVNANPFLRPEIGKGIEMGYDHFSTWFYRFSESIEYDFVSQQYINAGGYESKGVKYDDYIMTDYGNFGVLVAYQVTDQIRVPKYKTRLSWFDGDDEFDYELSWVAQKDRGNDFDGSAIEDVNTINLVLGFNLSPKYRLSLQINDILDREFEVLPGYGAGGRTVFLGFGLTY